MRLSRRSVIFMLKHLGFRRKTHRHIEKTQFNIEKYWFKLANGAFIVVIVQYLIGKGPSSNDSRHNKSFGHLFLSHYTISAHVSINILKTAISIHEDAF